MMDAKIIPEDAAAAIILLIGLPQNWPSTTGFDLGLDLLAVSQFVVYNVKTINNEKDIYLINVTLYDKCVCSKCCWHLHW